LIDGPGRINSIFSTLLKDTQEVKISHLHPESFDKVTIIG